MSNGSSFYPPGYLQQNATLSKKLNMVVTIADVPGYFSVVPFYTKIRYGDPGITYGETGLKYGGLRLVDNVRPWLTQDSFPTISQKNEPEQGRASVSTMTLKFIDFDGYMSQLIAPGIIVDEPLGNKLVQIYFGYTNTSFPDDYIRGFQGFISNTTSGAGWVTLELSDANIKSRQSICVGGVNQLAADMSATDSVAQVGSVSGYFAPVTDVNGDIDWALRDILTLGTTSSGSNVITGVASTVGILSGYAVAGPGIPVGATVVSVTTNTITMTLNATANFTGTPVLCVGAPDNDYTTRAWILIDSEFMEYSPKGLFQGLTFTGNVSSTVNPTVITNVSTVTGLQLGQAITGSYIPADTVVTAIDPIGLTVTMSNSATGTASDITINAQPLLIVFRGGQYSRSTTIDAHTVLTEVDNAVQFQGNPVEIILKMFLSGFGGPWMTGVSCTALGTTLEPGVPEFGAILFSVDVVQTYGLVIGDQIQVSGSAMGNDGSYIITGIQNGTDGDLNRIVIVDTTFTIENPASSVSLAFRSQYDTLPTLCGLMNTPQSVDVPGFQNAQLIYFSTGQYLVQLFIQAEITGKSFLEDECFLPIGAYSITRQGKLSIAVTSPPLVSQTLLQLDDTNVINPTKITIQRALNTRRFYNLIQYNFDEDDQGNFGSTVNLLDTNSEALTGLTMELPINSLGLKSALGAEVVVAARGNALLNRFKGAAYEINLSVNWEAGSQIEVGDVIILYDPGTLQITNLETGERGLGRQLYEVIGRTLKPQNGNADLILLSSLGYTLNQRYATFAPSSIVGSGSTTASIIITDSYGPLFPGDEQRKWTSLIGETITVHDPLWAAQSSAVILGFDPSNPYRMLLASNLSFTPAEGDIVDLANYGTGTDPTFNATAKLLFASIDPTATVVSGVSQTAFTVSSGDAAKFVVGLPILIHDVAYDIVSPEVNVESISGTTINLSAPLGFVPAADQLVEGIGFPDGGGPYRWV